MKKHRVWAMLLCVTMIVTSVPTVALAEEGANSIEMETVINRAPEEVETQALTDVAESLLDSVLNESLTDPLLTESVPITDEETVGTEEHGDIVEPEIIAKPEVVPELKSVPEGYKEWTKTDALPTTTGQYKLMTDVALTVPSVGTGNAEITLDLNGYTVQAPLKEAALQPSKGCALTIEDSSPAKTGKITNSAGTDRASLIDLHREGTSITVKGGTFENTRKQGSAVDMNGSAKAEISGGTFENTGSQGGAIDMNGSATAEISGGTFENTGSQGSAIAMNGFAKAEISGGTFENTGSNGSGVAMNKDAIAKISGGTFENIGSNGRGVAMNGSATAEISGGTFENNESGGNAVFLNGSATAEIFDGTFKGNGGHALFLNGYATAEILGGMFNSDESVAWVGVTAKISATGGVFSQDVSEYIVEGYTCDVQDDGMYAVHGVASVVEVIGGASYSTLAAAVEAAGSGCTVKLLQNITMATVDIVTIPSDKILTLDMAGKSITTDTSFAGRPIVNQGTLTITGNGTIDSSASETGGYGAINNKGTLTIKNGTYRGAIYASCSVIRNTGSSAILTIEDGTFEEATCAVYNEGTAVINGGTFFGKTCSTCNKDIWSYTIRNNTVDSKMTINGGTFIGTQGAASAAIGYLEVNGGSFKTVDCAKNHGAIFYALYAAGEVGKVKCVINGGTFETVGKYSAVLIGNDTPGDGGINEKATAYINGGTFNAPPGIPALKGAKETGDPIISGGTFSSDPKAYVASGYSIRKSGDKFEVYKPSSGGSSSSSTTPPPKTETDTTTEGDLTIKSETTTTVNKDGSKTTETKETAINAVTGEKTELKVTETVDAKTGTSATTTVKTDETGKTVANLVVENTKGAKSVTVSADALKAAAKADEATMTVKTAGTAITLDASAIAAVAATKGETVAIAVETVKPESLPEAAKEALKNAVVVDLSINVGDNKVGSFNGGKATVAVAYTKTDSTKAVAVYYVDAAGALTRVPGATYDEKAKSVTFSTGHFSYYAMVEETALAFTDVKEGDWYYDAVRFVTEAKLFKGTGASTFGPTGTMTREMLVTVLYHKAGSPATSGMLLGEFADSAKVSTWAEDAMRWAVQKGILNGVGANKLDPRGAVTRQQLAVILYRAADNPEVGGMALSKFADGAAVANWAVNGMTWAVETGVITGRGGNTLAPTGTATRAEVATMLMHIDIFSPKPKPH